MKLIKEVSPPCTCLDKLWVFYQNRIDENGIPTLGIGSEVECDCGTRYTLADSQIDGKFWMKIVPAKVKIYRDVHDRERVG